MIGAAILLQLQLLLPCRLTHTARATGSLCHRQRVPQAASTTGSEYPRQLVPQAARATSSECDEQRWLR